MRVFRLILYADMPVEYHRRLSRHIGSLDFLPAVGVEKVYSPTLRRCDVLILGRRVQSDLNEFGQGLKCLREAFFRWRLRRYVDTPINTASTPRITPRVI